MTLIPDFPTLRPLQEKDIKLRQIANKKPILDTDLLKSKLIFFPF